MKYTEEELSEELERVSQKYCGGEAPKRKEMAEYSKISPSTYRYRYDSWSDALDYFGFQPNKNKKSITKQKLIKDILRVSDKLDGYDIPTSIDLDKHGKYSHGTYDNYFGSIGEALEEAGFSSDNDGVFVRSGKENRKYSGGTCNYYGPSWEKQREACLERDNYSCRVCGKTSKQISKNPDVHHIIPRKLWNVEEEHESMNSLDNLVSLCSKHHNIGIEGKWKKCHPKEWVEEALEYYGLSQD